jgi:hypothetical protein
MFTAQQHADLGSLLMAWREHPNVLDMDVLHAGVAHIVGPATTTAWRWYNGMMEACDPVRSCIIISQNITSLSTPAGSPFDKSL